MYFRCCERSCNRRSFSKSFRLLRHFSSPTSSFAGNKPRSMHEEHRGNGQDVHLANRSSVYSCRHHGRACRLCTLRQRYRPSLEADSLVLSYFKSYTQPRRPVGGFIPVCLAAGITQSPRRGVQRVVLCGQVEIIYRPFLHLVFPFHLCCQDSHCFCGLSYVVYSWISITGAFKRAHHHSNYGSTIA